MAKPIFALFVAALGSSVAFADGVAVGENILNSPELPATEDGLPLNWNYNFEGNKGRLRIVGEGDAREAVFSHGKEVCQLVQDGIYLVPGAKYKLGGWVRTKKLKASMYGLVVTPFAWASSHGPAIPTDTGGEWRWIEKTFEAPKSLHETYACRVYVGGFESGSLSVRGLSLTAVDEEGARGVVRAPRYGDYRRITPLMPRLEDIPAGDSEFLFAYMVPDRKPRTCRVWTTMEGEAEKSHGDIPVVDGRFSVKMSDMKEGARGVLRAEAFLDGKVECTVRYDIAVRKRVPISHPAERRLNNMVTRLLTANASDGDTAFSAGRDGWVLVALERAGAGLEVRLDDSPQPLVPSRRTAGFETMVRVSRGDHRLRVRGSAGGRLLVNAIPGLYCYSMPGNIKPMDGYAPFRGDFFTNRLCAALNQWGYGYGEAGFSKAEWNDFYARGKERVGHMVPWRKNCEGYDGRYEPAELMAKRFSRSTLPSYTYDEIYMESFRPKWNYADAMRLLQGAESAPCVWSSGTHFPYTALDAEYYSACLNAAHGRGRFFFEIYPYFTTKDLSEAEKSMASILDETRDRAVRLIPDGLKGSYFVMGMYTGMGKFCYDTTCDSDPKWYYNRFVEKIATEPKFDGLCGFGIYAYGSSEEEDVRWACALVRHYLLKGSRDDFAALNGIALDPKTVLNGNFAKGLEGWTVEGDVQADNVPGYASSVQRRRMPANKGNEVAVFRRAKSGKSRLTQTMGGLVPGRIYALRYTVSPMKEIVKGAKAGEVRRYGLTAKVEGAEDVTAQMPIARYGGAERNLPKLNVRTVVFKALGTSATLDFALDDCGDATEELVLSAVRVRPYFLD